MTQNIKILFKIQIMLTIFALITPILVSFTLPSAFEIEVMFGIPYWQSSAQLMIFFITLPLVIISFVKYSKGERQLKHNQKKGMRRIKIAYAVNILSIVVLIAIRVFLVD